MLILAADTVAPVESVTVPDRSPVRSAKDGATINNKLNNAAINTRTADLHIATVPPRENANQISHLALLPPGQSYLRPGASSQCNAHATQKLKTIFLQY